MPARALHQAIGSLYDAAAGEASWGDAARGIAMALGAGTAVLHLADGRQPGPPLAIATHGIDAAASRAYAEHYHAHDPLAQALRHAAPGQMVRGWHAVEPQAFAKSVFWNEYNAPWLDGWHALGCVLPGTHGALLLTRPSRARDFAAADLARMQALAGHAARAVRLHLLSAGQRLGESAFAAMPAAAILADGQGRFLLANAAAEALCARHALLLERGGLLLPMLAQRAQLLALLAAAAHGDSAAALELAPGLRAQLQPMPRYAQGQALLILREVPAMPVLTPAEALIAAALAAGQRPAGIAAARGVSITTIRSQVRALMTKTGTPSLAALAAFCAARMMPGDGG